MHKVTCIQPDPQDWQLLEQIAMIDQQAFGEDGISVFNLSQFTRSGSVFCLALERMVLAEAVVLRNLHDTGAVVFAFAVDQKHQGHGHVLSAHDAEYRAPKSNFPTSRGRHTAPVVFC